MFPRAHRLHTKRDLSRVRASRRAFRTPHLILRVVRRQERDGPPRVAIAVSRRVSPRAVERNKVTRRLREAFRRELPHVRRGVDLFLSPQAAAATYTWDVVQENLHTLLQRANLLSQDQP